METQWLDGKALAVEVVADLASRAKELQGRGIVSKLVVILVGEEPASQIYVKHKQRACRQVGIESEIIKLSMDTTANQLGRVIDQLNEDVSVNGILLQLPLPAHLDSQAFIARISPAKDVDGFHPINVGRLVLGQNGLVSCTPKGILRLLDAYNLSIEGKHCVVIGRSNIVGKPMSLLLLQRHGTVTITHSRTEQLRALTQQADILVVAIGQPEAITGQDIKPGAVVVDVGIHRLADGRLCGDVEQQSCLGVAGFLSPVPGGVGPMTIAMLMENCLLATEQQVR